jgi:hypothetical protein
MKTIKISEKDSIPNNFTGIAEYQNGTKIWFKERNIHREDGPAIEQSDGIKIWYIEGKIHRLDGPAIEYSAGRKEWWIEDYLYSPEKLSYFTNSSVYLGKEKGQHGLEWLKFLTENGIEEFPIIPGMEEYKDIKKIFKELEK